MKKIAVIGSGFSSLAAASYLACPQTDVHIYEKNKCVGGRARQLRKEGFVFDMGPSFYWMPDVFEKFFGDFEKSVADYYQLVRLSPSYSVFFKDGNRFDVPTNKKEILQKFEAEEKGSSEQLEKFLLIAKDNYEIAMNDLVYKPGLSLFELITPATITRLTRFMGTIRKTVNKKFKNPRLRQLLEFPVLFLGAKPQNTPGFYNFMNYADFVLGTWYPHGGMYSVVKAMENLALSRGVKIHTQAPVTRMYTKDNIVKGLEINGERFAADVVLSGADYHHTESLLPGKFRNYSENYWKNKVFSPSALLFYVAFDKRLKNLTHHSLFFDADFDQHASAIYDSPKWPESPLFYASFPSMTDDTMAPPRKESGTFLIPIAPGLDDSAELREKYFDIILDRLENHTGQKIKNAVIFKQTYSIRDFMRDYHSYKGNAYGLANTLRQTAFLRPKIKSMKLKNLYFTGQLTVPGPGVPPAIISGKIAANLIIKEQLPEINQ